MWYLFTYINFWIFKDDCFEEMEVLYEILYIILKSLKYIFIFIYNFMNKCVLWEYFKFNLKLVAPVEDIVWQRWDQLEDGKVITQGTSVVEDIYKRMHFKKHSSTHSLYTVWQIISTQNKLVSYVKWEKYEFKSTSVFT